MLREAGSGKKHAGGILQPSHSPRCVCVCATKIRYLQDTVGGHMSKT